MCDNLINQKLEECLEVILLLKDNTFDQTTLRKEFKDFTLVISVTRIITISVFKKNSCNMDEELANYIMNLWKTKFQVRLNKPNETEV